MSFIQNDTSAKVYAPAYFLAHEECVRETREISQEGATITEDGAKYVKMGTAYPSNDGNAIGIVYEDVDVSSGNMAGSVVTQGVVYEDRLAVTGSSYSAVTPESGDNPSAKGWYEKDGNNYVLSTDTTVDSEKTYYAKSDVRLTPAAKSALEALGFKFVAEPAVTRPY